jgi:hypothetical protein
MAVLNGVADGQLFLAKNTIRATFINAGQLAKGVSTDLSDDGYQAVFSKTMDDYSKRAANESEIDYFNRFDQLILSSDDREAPIRRLILPLVSSLIAERDRAEAARQEQARIAQQEAAEQAQREAEQARIAQQEAIERRNAVIAAMEKRRTDAISLSLGQSEGPINVSQLAALLVNKAVSPKVEVGRNGKMQNEGEWKAAKTVVFPSGHERFQISEIPFGDLLADQYQTWGPAVYTISGVEAKKDHLQIKISMVLIPTARGEIKFMLGKDWQSSMTNQQVIDAIEKWFPINW